MNGFFNSGMSTCRIRIKHRLLTKLPPENIFFSSLSLLSTNCNQKLVILTWDGCRTEFRPQDRSHLLFEDIGQKKWFPGEIYFVISVYNLVICLFILSITTLFFYAGTLPWFLDWCLGWGYAIPIYPREPEARELTPEMSRNHGRVPA